ncbi:MAG: acryloyl-CoA reductase [Actinomycetia bacterium]|nr:acryloyl-CoA reductase [Actinomycetes bacterium]MCP4962040.1 acryloyl-CoA reductase [Actinomycetes bacterium]
MDSFSAFLVGKVDDVWTQRVEDLTVDDLPDGDVLVEVEYSGINYKDGLASTEAGRVARIDPLIPGVDLAGTVVQDGGGFVAGDRVIAHGYDIGVAHHGGYARYARVPSGWVVPMPDGLNAMQAMLVGTAGYTAALSVEALESHGLTPGDGPVLVTGATGGVGSMAVGMLAKRGYEIVASSGKADQVGWLRDLGAAEVVGREETSAESKRPLESERWAGCVDCVGGNTLAYALRTTRYGGTVAASGLTGGAALPTTVLPFILRGVTLAGIDSVMNPIEQRIPVWQRISTDLRPAQLDGPAPTVVGFDALGVELDRILAGGMVGRTLVSPTV